MTLAKPVMRGLLTAQIKKNLVIGCSLAVVSAIGWKYLILEARKNQYAEFYKTYDPMADWERMKNTGHFESVADE